MYRQHTMRDSAKFIGVISVMVATVIPVSAQQPASPLRRHLPRAAIPMEASCRRSIRRSISRSPCRRARPGCAPLRRASPPPHPFKPICPKA